MRFKHTNNHPVKCPVCGWEVNYGGLGAHFRNNHHFIVHLMAVPFRYNAGVGDQLRIWYDDGQLEERLKPLITLATLEGLGS